MKEFKIKIENLYKIFGAAPESVLVQVRQGFTKQELLEKHSHVLGLTDINIEIPVRKISVILGVEFQNN